MNEDIKFSVTVPAYKPQYLVECIDSILAQTYKNFELIIVNDASPHDLDSIIANYDDSRIRYYKNKVGFGAEHVVGNWNKCLEYSTGDYIICMGDDDKLLPYCLEEFVKLIKRNPGLGVYHGWPMQIDEDSNIIKVEHPFPERESVYSVIYSRLTLRLQYIGDFAYDVNLLRINGGFYYLPYAWGSDDMSSYIASVSAGIAHTSVPVFQYRVNRHSISLSRYNKGKMMAIKMQFDWIKNFVDQEPIVSDVNSLLFRKLISEQYVSFLKKNAQTYIKHDMTSSINKFAALSYWLKRRNDYHMAALNLWGIMFESCIPISSIIRRFKRLMNKR